MYTYIHEEFMLAYCRARTGRSVYNDKYRLFGNMVLAINIGMMKI